MTKEQWEEFRKELSSPFGSIKMKLDSYDVNFIIERVKAKNILTYQYVIMTYIKSAEDDGKYMFKGVWLNDDCEIRNKFYRKIEKFLYTAKERIKAEKELKRYKKLDKAFYDKQMENYQKSFIFYSPQWKSPVALKNHLLKNCTSIELIKKDGLNGN